ncbi:PREDICTED: uncharacterized protein LOC101291757 [Fragaria vesca subsp. vesca]
MKKPKAQDIMSTMKIGKLMEQPASVLMGHLFKLGSGETYQPSPLLELFRKNLPMTCLLVSIIDRIENFCMNNSISSRPLPPEPSSWSPPGRQIYQYQVKYLSQCSCFQFPYLSENYSQVQVYVGQVSFS